MVGLQHIENFIMFCMLEKYFSYESWHGGNHGQATGLFIEALKKLKAILG
jgi:hypothetical protein